MKDVWVIVVPEVAGKKPNEAQRCWNVNAMLCFYKVFISVSTAATNKRLFFFFGAEQIYNKLAIAIQHMLETKEEEAS